MGNVPEGPPFYFAETPTEVGFVYNFSATVTGRGTDAEGCENCQVQQEEGALGSGQVILTDYLVENITKERTLRGLMLQSLSRDEVIEYLKKNLHWLISDVSFKPVNQSSTCNLTLTCAVKLARRQYNPERDHAVSENFRCAGQSDSLCRPISLL